MSAQENTDKPVPQVPEENTTEGTKPSPSTSPATRRLSVLINKAKKSISQAADKVSSPTDSTHHAKSSEPATTTENTGTSDEPAAAAAANPTTEATTTTTTSDGAEKRRSRLVENFENFFHRSKVSENKM